MNAAVNCQIRPSLLTPSATRRSSKSCGRCVAWRASSNIHRQAAVLTEAHRASLGQGEQGRRAAADSADVEDPVILHDEVAPVAR